MCFVVGKIVCKMIPNSSFCFLCCMVWFALLVEIKNIQDARSVHKNKHDITRIRRVLYGNDCTGGPPYPRFTAAPKNWKIKEINGL